MSARQLLDRIWLVGSGTDRAAFTDDHDCHCYLVFDGSSGFLIDAGTGRAAQQWLANVSEVCALDDLAGVILTHYHADHAGGAAAARRAGLAVFGHPLTAAALASADETVTSLAIARDVGVYPADYRLEPAQIEPLTVGRPLRAATVTLDILDAPGHSDGHVVVRGRAEDRSVLFSGDCLFAQGRVSIQALHDCRLERYAETVISLAATHTDALLAGHGDIVLAGAQDGIERAAQHFRRLVPPPNQLSGPNDDRPGRS